MRYSNVLNVYRKWAYNFLLYFEKRAVKEPHVPSKVRAFMTIVTFNRHASTVYRSSSGIFFFFLVVTRHKRLVDPHNSWRPTRVNFADAAHSSGGSHIKNAFSPCDINITLRQRPCLSSGDIHLGRPSF